MKTLKELETEVTILETTLANENNNILKMEKELTDLGVDLNDPDGFLAKLATEISTKQAEFDSLLTSTSTAIEDAKKAMNE